MPEYVLSAATNLIAAAIAAIVTWLFVANQRAMRLNEQLNQLAKIVSGADENKIESTWADENEREKFWKVALKDISADVTSGSDRLVRLNAHSKRKLEALPDQLYTDIASRALALHFGEAVLPRTVTGREKLLLKIKEFQARLGVLSFVELPWCRWQN